MIIDAHIKVGPSFNGRGKLIEDYFQEMSKNGIDKAVICPNRPISYSISEGNRYIADAIDKYPGKFIGSLRVDPWSWDIASDDIAKYFDGKKFRFLYLNPWEDNFRCNDPEVYEIYRKAVEINAPVIIETGYPIVSHITQIGELARLFPELNIVATNAGQIDLSGFTLGDVGLIMRSHGNVYVGTAAAVGAEWLTGLIETSAEGRVLFETGYPFFDPYMEKYRISHSYTTDAFKDMVFGGNLLKLLG